VLHHFGGPDDGPRVCGPAGRRWARMPGLDGTGGAERGVYHLNGTVFRLNKDGSNYESLQPLRRRDRRGLTGPKARDTGQRRRTVWARRAKVGVEGISQCLQTAAGRLRVHHDPELFRLCGDGSESSSRLLAATDGYLYGTTLKVALFEIRQRFSRCALKGRITNCCADFGFDSNDGYQPLRGAQRRRPMACCMVARRATAAARMRARFSN